ncbi:cell envelope integrity protein TolA [Proteus mirabilis]|uniref:cell envelope integrity protein TolA n=1 Tax=Proteus mirabilis TaxID=584 RepID=UPI0020351D4A|nr:cell envelope integrity protein TolA [Proteus mirabilis]MCT8202908.1 cell envelope integrity protein TolA [Proteus mirabilis]MDF7140376.1 cell envelope integrity protein TolA [Proteus mirabilis]MDF7411564.1 cell envelope integrity protein TolA [Proteus mirabilis]USA24774.1 cell envelope integrity protein TolA [Proteus mirabilis]HCU0193663.1 cell envelope integrity protein TolA [Proteus mirabilis]
MGKKTKPIRSKLSGSVILSTVLHLLIIALLIWGSLTQKWNLGGGGGSDGQVIDAIMVDPNAVVQEYNQQKAQQANVQKAEQERKARAQQQEEELRQQQIKEQERLKALEVERLQAKEAAEAAAQAKAERDRILKEQADAKAKAEAEAKKQAELAAKQKAEEAKAKAEAEAKAKAEADAKAKAEADAKAKAAAEAKAKAAAEAKAKAAAQQQSKAVDSLLDGLVAQGDKQSGASAAGQGGGNRSGANAAGIDRYTGQVKVAIEQKFFDSDLYKGRKCDLKISIAPDGMLVSAKAVGGDPALCQVALQAAKMATLPKPPKDIYEQVKSPTIEFKP